MAKLQAIQKNPKAGIQEIGSDPRFMSVLGMLLGIDMSVLPGGAGGGEPMQTDEPVAPPLLPSWIFADLRPVCLHHLLLHPENNRKLNLRLQRRLRPLCNRKKLLRTKKKPRAMKRIKLVPLTPQSRITRKHGNYTRISHTSITSPPRTLKRETIKRVLRKHKRQWKKEEKSVPISNLSQSHAPTHPETPCSGSRTDVCVGHSAGSGQIMSSWGTMIRRFSISSVV
jgi:hypothetical protein